jgi:integrase
MSKKTTKRTKRPKFTVGPVRVRATRGPKDDGRWYWRAVVYRDSAEHTLWTGWATRDMAEADIAGRVAAGDTEPKDNATTEALPRTVGDLMECWMYAEEQRQDIKAKTKQVNKYYARKVKAYLGHVALRQLYFHHLATFRDDRLKAGAAPNVVRGEIAVLRRAWQWGVDHRYCPDRRLPRPLLKARPVRFKRTPSVEDVRRALAKMDPKGWPFLTTLLIAETGMRVGEVAALTWENIDLDQGIAKVPHQGKTGRRDVPLSRSLTTYLEGVRAGAPDDARVLPVVEGTVLTSLSQRYIPDACEAAGVERFTPHGVRRMVVDTLYNAGNDPTLLADYLGHSPQTAQRYYRTVPLELKRATKLNSAIGDIAQGLLPAVGGELAQGIHFTSNPHTLTRTTGDKADANATLRTFNNV